MKNKLKTYFGLIILILTFIGCQSNHKELTKKEYRVLENCINYIKKNNEHGMKDEFIVDPYFNYFVISNFFESSNKEFVDLFDRKSKKEYKDLEKAINKSYAGVYNKDLLSLSGSDSANFILGFSGIAKNMVIGYLTYNSKKVSKLTEMKNYEGDWNSTTYFIFILDDDGNINQVITTIGTIG